MIVIIMGVAGSGKSTVARALADETGWSFVEGDDLHPRENIEKMRRGVALDDVDRDPWLAALAEAVARIDDAGADIVVACSALRERYRRTLDPAGRATFVHLVAPPELIARRLSERAGHFFDPLLLESQLDALEPPDDALAVDASRPVGEIVREIRRHLDI